ncbi:MAG TPA: aldo/keto reductase [Ktedonobacteraceae bacterium]|nr:aldo/keto reductase [Ktedonobacteraceae bacterium]
MIQTEQRKLGASEIVVPALGIGTMSWGERMMGYGKAHTRDDVTQAYRACLDAGLNFFDTAEGYGMGENERLLGECRRQDGRPAVIATKYAPASLFAPIPTRLSPRALLKSLDRSLQRLGVERIDLYQIHFPTSPSRVDALMDVLAEAVQAGKVRAVGVSNYSASLMRQAHARLARHGIALASNQVHYNLLHRYPETNGVLSTCQELNVALIAYSPLEQGILSGKYRTTPQSRPLTLRIIRSISPRDPFGEMEGASYGRRDLQPEKLEPLFAVLEEIAIAHEKTIAQVALNWLLTRDACIVPIPGAKNARQVHEHVGALGWRLTEEEHLRISQAEIASR